MQLLEKWIYFASGAAYEVIVVSCFVFQTLIDAASLVVAKLV